MARDVKAPLDVKTPPDDTASIASSFASVSPTPSVTTEQLDDEPPPYSSIEHEHPLQWTSQDPRNNSTQSLVNQDVNADTRRKLLLIYIHGFMGNETSFQSFPAHVHNLVTVLLQDSHVVHTKIYPRYLTKRVLGAAASDFSKWLAPHEGPDTDVVLLGHSMGGLLAAEVTLLPPELYAAWPLRHRILGTINFDVPFLGMHPGIVKSGLTSIFKPYPSPAQAPASQSSSAAAEPFWLSGPGDSTYNPAFPNDVNLPQRKGWKNALHFVNKHSTNLTSATRQLIQNHIEFGSCLAEFDNLKVRYVRLRMLEEEDEQKRGSVVEGRYAPRVRFVNYYTVSKGRPKKGKSPAGGESTPSLLTVRTNDSQRTESDDMSSASFNQGRSASVPGAMEHIDPRPEDDSDASDLSDFEEISTIDSLSTDNDGHVKSPTSLSHSDSMPQAPTPPGPPPSLVNYRCDMAGFKVALAEHRKAHKEYAHALRDHHKRLYQWRKEDAKRKQVERKAAQEAQAEELKVEAEMRNEEQRRIAEATTPEEKKMAIEWMRERRKRESDLRREQLKRKVETEKEQRKALMEAAKADRKSEKSKMKSERKSEKDAMKHEVKQAMNEMKQQGKLQKMDRKEMRRIEKQARNGGSGFPAVNSFGSSSTTTVPDLKEVIYDADQNLGESSSAPNIIRSTSDNWPDEKMPPSVAGSEDTSSKSDERKDRKFCLLPPKDSNGNVDYTWRRVFMQDVDEVGAHCGLFFPKGITGAEAVAGGQEWGQRYADLIGNVAEQIESWVHEDMTERMVRGVQAL